MASVIQYSWPIFIFCAGILLLLVGCATLSTRMSTQNVTESFPLVTLTVVPFSSPLNTLYATPSAPEIEVSLPPPEWRTTRSSSSGVGLNDPTCYNSPNQGFTCLGQIWNQTGQTLSNITLRVSLFGAGGQVVAEQVIGLDQYHLPPAAAAPYRAQFSAIDTHNPSVTTVVETVSKVNLSHLPLHVTNEQGRATSSGRYIVTADLHNASTKLATYIRLIVTVLDAENRVVGYRVQQLRPMPAAATQSIRMEIIPQIMAEDLHHLLQVEAWGSE